MRNWLIGLLLVAAVLCGGWYFASPLYAMKSLRDAAQSGDQAALEGAVDFPVLRDSLKAQMRKQAEARLGDIAGGELGAFGASIGTAIIDPFVDGLVTPEAISTMVKQADVIRREPADDGSEGQAERVEGDWTLERDGLSRFTARPVTEDGPSATGLVFERRGLGWKLVAIELPEVADVHL